MSHLNSSKSNLPTWRYLQSVIPSIIVISGNLLGGNWAWGNCFFSLVLMVIIDFVVPARNENHEFSENKIPDFILVLGCVFHWFSVASLIFGISNGILIGSSITWAAISTGLNSGLIGITSAHELIHRKSLKFRSLGIINLVLCGYGHFYVEHRKGHHSFVGTPKDPATARKGESFYAFLIRTIPGQWFSAFEIERGRIKRISGNHFLSNFVVNISLLQLSIFLVLYLLFNPDAGYAFALQAFISIVLLEFVNYIEHYGLVRNPKEKIEAKHAWQSNSATSRFTLFELSRHSHHHIDSKIQYQNLKSLESPYKLPFGYYGMFYIALIPPLWFKVMDHRI